VVSLQFTHVRSLVCRGSFFWVTNRGVTRLDGSRGKKQVWRPMFELEVFRKQMHCVEESTLLGLFVLLESTLLGRFVLNVLYWRKYIVGAFWRPHSDLPPGELYHRRPTVQYQFRFATIFKVKKFFSCLQIFSNLGIFVSQPWDIVILSGNLAFQVADDAMQMDVHKTLNPF